MTYTDVQAILDGNEEIVRKYREIVPMIKNMRSLQLVLTKKRSERGSIDLDVRDSHITIKDEIIDVEPQIISNCLAYTAYTKNLLQKKQAILSRF